MSSSDERIDAALARVKAALPSVAQQSQLDEILSKALSAPDKTGLSASLALTPERYAFINKSSAPLDVKNAAIATLRLADNAIKNLRDGAAQEKPISTADLAHMAAEASQLAYLRPDKQELLTRNIIRQGDTLSGIARSEQASDLFAQAKQAVGNKNALAVVSVAIAAKNGFEDMQHIQAGGHFTLPSKAELIASIEKMRASGAIAPDGHFTFALNDHPLKLADILTPKTRLDTKLASASPRSH